MSVVKKYRSENGAHIFKFRFIEQEGRVDIFCLVHPELNGADPDPHKTHLFPSGRLCFVSGREPHDQSQAEERAKQWAEFFVNYCN